MEHWQLKMSLYYDRIIHLTLFFQVYSLFIEQEAHGPHCSHEKNIPSNKHMIILAHRSKVYSISPWKRGIALHLSKLKFLWCFGPVWVELTQLFVRWRFLKVVNAFSLCHYYHPSEKGVTLFLNKHKSPLHKDELRQV